VLPPDYERLVIGSRKWVPPPNGVSVLNPIVVSFNACMKTLTRGAKASTVVLPRIPSTGSAHAVSGHAAAKPRNEFAPSDH